MSNVLDNTKSTLGKLLAAENIRIEHRQVRGPSFDVKNRVLVLPIWKEIDADLYDLMIGHEVGHALYTPTDGWMDRVQEHGKNFKGILNVVEDARIEKLMKRKFPGLRKPMYNGYTQLVERGFFGVGLDDMKHLPFADRVNVHFKLGPRAGITFTDAEQNLVSRIENAETWDEVMSLSEELFAAADGEFNDISDDIFDNLDALSDAIDNMDEGGEGEGTGEGYGEYSSDTPGSGKTLQDVIDQLRAAGKDNAADKLERMSKSNAYRRMMTEWAENQEMGSITDEALEANQEKLIDEDAYPNTYIFWPELNHKDYVIPARVVHQQMRSEYKPEYLAKENDLYNTFMSTNRNYIKYLVKEFELKRNAKQFAKARVSKTGKLNTEKLWRYQISEDLFLQSTEIPNGKNHGMLMVIDLSSSMTENMAGTIEQIINLSMFCRKVNIPFDVYGFIDTSAEKDFMLSGITRSESKHPIFGTMYRTRPNDNRDRSIQINNFDFRLKQLLHYNMGAAEFNVSVKNLLLLANAYKRSANYYYYSSSYHHVPPSMHLGGTPLNEAVLVLRSLAEEFKKNTRVEILNTVLLTDGEASYGLAFKDGEQMGNAGGIYRGRIVIEDRKTKKQVMVSKCGNITLALLEMYRQHTGSRVVGFYLMSGRNYRSQVMGTLTRNNPEFNQEVFDKQYADEFAKYKYFGMKLAGYDVYYMVPGDELEVEDVDMDTVLKSYKDGSKKGSLLKAFKKMQNTKMISRVFLNRFIEQMA